MLAKPEYMEAKKIAEHLMEALVNFPVAASDAGAAMRVAVGKFMVRFSDLIYDRTIGTELYDCFEKARAAGATLNSMDRVREVMLAETPMYPVGNAIVNAAVIFSFVEQSQIIAIMVFASRFEAGAIMDAMSKVIEEIKVEKADSFVSGDYQHFVRLAALLVEHLSATERLLPRIVSYQWPVHYPSLTMANRIYGDGARSEELIAENKTVHPAFMQRHIIALSS
jgi:hypothetical protein